MSEKFDFGIEWLDRLSDPSDRLSAKIAYENSLSWRTNAGTAETTQLQGFLLQQARSDYPLCPADYDELGSI